MQLVQFQFIAKAYHWLLLAVKCVAMATGHANNVVSQHTTCGNSFLHRYFHFDTLAPSQ